MSTENLNTEEAKATGRLVVISAPSGAGKTSLVNALLANAPHARFSTSYTTRDPRPGEQDGKDYYFVSHEDFARMVDEGEFLEYATVFDHAYGTSRRQVKALMEQGHDVLLEIDWQGANQVRKSMPDCLSIFILPPSVDELENRLRGRSTDTEQVVRRRLRDARKDMSHWIEFDYAVVNESFGEATQALQDILAGDGEHYRIQNPEVRRHIAKVIA